MASQEIEIMDFVEVEIASATEPRQEQAQNPWPHLDEFFLLKSGEGDKLVFQCLVCLPKTVLIKGHMTSLNNLKQHIKRTHPVKFKQFEEKVKVGSSRGKGKPWFSSGSSSCSSNSVVSPPFAKRARQQTIGESFSIGASGIGVPQSAVDQRIVDLFVDNMLSLQVVESDTFERLIKTLNPSKSSISRRTLGRRIVNSYNDLKQYLIR